MKKTKKDEDSARLQILHRELEESAETWAEARARQDSADAAIRPAWRRHPRLDELDDPRRRGR